MIGFDLTFLVIEIQQRFSVFHCFSDKACCDGIEFVDLSGFDNPVVWDRVKRLFVVYLRN